jgi:prevent-host-death family protein
VSGHWQMQEAKQRFGELIRFVEAEGPQIVTRHGEEVAVVIDIAEDRRLREPGPDFKQFLRSAPDSEVLTIDRPATPARVVLGSVRGISENAASQRVRLP